MSPETAALEVARLVGGPVGRAWALTGGLLNHVFRVERGETTVVLKHAPDHVATAPEISLDPGRIGFEARALLALGPGGELEGLGGEAVRVPVLLAWDPPGHTIVVEDLGDWPGLDTWFVDASDRQLERRVSGAIEFVTALHRRSAALPELAERFDNRAVQETRMAVQYDAVGAWLEAVAHPQAKRLGAAARALGARFLEPGFTLVMGDLWPRSLLIGPTTTGLIDWEFCHWGHPAQDLGHLAAHLWMLEHRRPDRAGTQPGATGLARIGPGGLHPVVLQAVEASGSGSLCWQHAGCELLARTLGPFRAGYLYEHASESVIAQAMAQAADWLDS